MPSCPRLCNAAALRAILLRGGAGWGRVRAFVQWKDLPMRLILTALVFLAGLFDLFLAIGFLTGPVQAATGFGIAPTGPGGVSTIRADFTAFFGVAAFCMMWGAWRRNADLLLVPALLFGTAFIGRAINFGIAGAYPGWALPMTVEAGHVALMLAAWRLLPHHRLDEIAA